MAVDNIARGLAASKVSSSEIGVAGGLATLDEAGKVPSTQLPSYVDDVLEYTSKADFPTIGEKGKIYVDISTNLVYRWSGSTYIEISPLELGETSTTAYAGDKGKANADNIATLQATTKTIQTDISTLQTNVETAQSTADTAVTAAETAQKTADSAQTTASAAQTAASAAQTTADGAQTAAENAQSTADAAQATATNAQTIVNTVLEQLGDVVFSITDDNLLHVARKTQE